jgi:uncharacterized protein YxjI
MKTPDALAHVELPEDQEEKIMELLKRWFQWGECCTLEVDTELETCVVLEV